MPKNKSTIQPDDILIGHTSEVHEIAEQLRRLIRAAVPDAAEVAYPGWHAIGYRQPESGYFCGIFPQTASVNLLFEWGVLLPDPDGLLVGDGKQVRFIPITNAATVPTEALRKLLHAALALPTSREVKLALIREAQG